MDNEDKVSQLNASLLLPGAVKEAEKWLSVTSADSETRPDLERELNDLRSRWEAEAPLRALRAAVERAGFRRSDYDRGTWIRRNKKTGRWDKFTAEQALREAGLL